VGIRQRGGGNPRPITRARGSGDRAGSCRRPEQVSRSRSPARARIGPVAEAVLRRALTPTGSGSSGMSVRCAPLRPPPGRLDRRCRGTEPGVAARCAQQAARSYDRPVRSHATSGSRRRRGLVTASPLSIADVWDGTGDGCRCTAALRRHAYRTDGSNSFRCGRLARTIAHVRRLSGSRRPLDSCSGQAAGWPCPNLGLRFGRLVPVQAPAVRRQRRRLFARRTAPGDHQRGGIHARVEGPDRRACGRAP
jgi:hypothetical protein